MKNTKPIQLIQYGLFKRCYVYVYCIFGCYHFSCDINIASPSFSTTIHHFHYFYTDSVRRN